MADAAWRENLDGVSVEVLPNGLVHVIVWGGRGNTWDPFNISSRFAANPEEIRGLAAALNDAADVIEEADGQDELRDMVAERRAARREAE